MVPPQLVPLGVILSVVAMIGGVGNLIMVILFFRFNKLRSPCHYLITMNCLGDGFHNIGQFIFVTHLFGEFKSSQFTCFLLNIPTLFGVISSACWMFVLGVDRFFVCKWPIRYRVISGFTSLYNMALCIFPLVYTCTFFYKSLMETNNKSVICSVPVAMGSETFVLWSTFNIIVNGITIVLYTCTYWFLVKRDTGNGRRQFRSVFKSIFVTVAFVVFGWSITCVANALVVRFISTDFGKQLVNMYAGIPVNVACASNIFIFYAINSDYRRYIKKMFGFKNAQVAALDTRTITTRAPPPQSLNETSC